MTIIFYKITYFFQFFQEQLAAHIEKDKQLSEKIHQHRLQKKDITNINKNLVRDIKTCNGIKLNKSVKCG